MPEDDARARIAAQADDDERRAAADVWLDNDGATAALGPRRLWHARLVPFERDVRHGIPAPDGPGCRPPTRLDGPGQRLVARVAARGRRGRGAGPRRLDRRAGLVAKDVIDVQVGVASLAAADAEAPSARRAGFAGARASARTTPRPACPAQAVPRPSQPRPPATSTSGRSAPGIGCALLFRDWLRAEAGEREAYAGLKQALAAAHARREDYAEAKEPWFDAADERARAWAERTGWARAGPRRDSDVRLDLRRCRVRGSHAARCHRTLGPVASVLTVDRHGRGLRGGWRRTGAEPSEPLRAGGSSRTGTTSSTEATPGSPLLSTVENVAAPLSRLAASLRVSHWNMQRHWTLASIAQRTG